MSACEYKLNQLAYMSAFKYKLNQSTSIVIFISSIEPLKMSLQRKTGPKRIFPLEKLESIFDKYESVIVTENKVKSPSDPIWEKIKSKFNIPSSSKSIYTDAWKWNLRRIKNQKKLPGAVSVVNDFVVAKEVTLNSTNSSFDSSVNISDVTNESLDDSNVITFQLTLTPEQWKTIEPVSKSYKRLADKSHKKGERVYQKLKPGAWTSLMADRIALHSKNIVCDWSLKHAQVSSEGNNYISVSAKCVTCNSKLSGILKNQPEENKAVLFDFRIQNFDETYHQDAEKKKKVKVTGTQARALATAQKPAITLHRQLSSKLGKLFQAPKGRVPSANAIRNLQSRERTKDRLSNDIFHSLQLLQAAPKYKKTIHMVGLSPFFVIYGSNNQIRLYNMYEKRNKISKMSCDATGSVIRKLGKIIQIKY